MTQDEQKLFTLLLLDHKHLWIAFQETKHLREFPDEDPETVHGRFVDAAYEVYLPIEDALLSGRPIQDMLEILRTILLASTIAQSEGKVF
jgi:hypothetical protein